MESEPSVARAPDCGVDATTKLTTGGIGNLRPGMAVSEARRACRVLRDSVGELEGMPQPMIIVDLGRDTVLAEIAGERVGRLNVEGPAFRTSEGLGVGSTVADVRAKGSARVALGEGTFILLAEACGLSFELGDPGVVRAIQRFGPDLSPADLPQNARVVGVLVYQCDPTHPVPASR